VLPLPKPLRERFGLIHITEGGDQPTTAWWVLRNSRFRLYFAGSVASDLGTWLQNTAQVLLVYHLGHSVFAVGLVTCAQFSSPLVLGPWAGVMADKFGGRRTLLGTQVVAGAIAAALGYMELVNKLNEIGLVSGAILSGLCFTFALPARNVTIQRLVSTKEVRAAYVMDSVSYNLGRAIAPLISVAVVYWVGFAWAFIGNAMSFGVFTLVLWAVGRQQGTAEPRRESRVLDGFHIALSEGRIMILLLMVAAVTIADDPILVLGPALANRMHMATTMSGWFIAALGVGSVLGSLRRSRHLPSLRLAATSLALLGGCMVLFVMTPWWWMSVAAAIGAGITCLVANSATRTLLSKAAGPGQVASVMAVWAVAWAGSKPFASLLDGFLATELGVRWTGVILALPALLPAVLLLLAPSLGKRLADIRRDRGQQPKLGTACASVTSQRHAPVAVATNSFPDLYP
jgi:MFS family permease